MLFQILETVRGGNLVDLATVTNLVDLITVTNLVDLITVTNLQIWLIWQIWEMCNKLALAES